LLFLSPIPVKRNMSLRRRILVHMRHARCPMPVKQNRPHPEDADGLKVPAVRDVYL
jgi:hypothetical protein